VTEKAVLKWLLGGWRVNEAKGGRCGAFQLYELTKAEFFCTGWKPVPPISLQPGGLSGIKVARFPLAFPLNLEL